MNNKPTKAEVMKMYAARWQTAAAKPVDAAKARAIEAIKRGLAAEAAAPNDWRKGV